MAALALALAAGTVGACAGTGSEEPVPAGVTPEGAVVATVAAQDEGEGRAGRTLLAIYMIGSDLEDDTLSGPGPDEERLGGAPSPYGAATADLHEIARAWSALDPEARRRLDLLVGFGGARKQLWQGIRHADGPCVAEDAEDGLFGSADCYALVDEGANMAARETFAAFVEAAAARGAAAERRILVLWDHGDPVRGLGPDRNHARRPGSRLDLAEIRAGLAAAEPAPDLVAIDACLMGALEVAKALSGRASYLVASEELVPGHGFDYGRLVAEAASPSGASAVELGRALVDGFLDGESLQVRERHGGPLVEALEHAASSGKTMALLDLEAVADVESALGALAAPLAARPAILTHGLYVERARSFDVRTQDGVLARSVDLAALASSVRGADATLEAPGRGLAEAVERAVVYAREDGTRPGAAGLSIRSPYAERSAANGWVPAWDEALDGLADAWAADLESPRIEAIAAEGEVFRVRASDETGLRSATLVAGLAEEGRERSLLFTAVMRPVEVSPDLATITYEAPGWDGRSLFLCGGPCAEGDANRAMVSGRQVGFNEAGGPSQVARGQIERDGEVQDVRFFVDVRDFGFEDVRMSFAPEAEGEAEDAPPPRTSSSLRELVGQRLRFRYEGIDTASGQPFARFTDWVALGEDWEFGMLPVDPRLRPVFHFQATDGAGNTSETELFEVAAAP